MGAGQRVAKMKHSAATLDDKYQVGSNRFYVTGTQALVRLPLLQRQLDVAAGLNTGGYISGYRGSPLGGVDIRCGPRASNSKPPMSISARR